MALTFVATSATGLAAAALAARIQAGRVGMTGLAMGALGSTVCGWTIGTLWQFHDKANLIFGTVPLGLCLLTFTALWAGWGVVAATQLLGRLLSERPRPFVFPAFLTTVWAFTALF